MFVASGIDITVAIIAAFGTLLVYDVFFVTFDREVTLVWPSRWSLIKALFFLNRYLPFIDTFLTLYLLVGKNTPSGCTTGFGVVIWLIITGYFISETILMIRTFAIWGCRRTMGFILLCLAAATFIPSAVIAHLEAISLEYKIDPNGGGCIKSRPSSRIIFIAYLLLIMCETVIVGLTLVQARRHYRASQIQTPLIKQLYRDGLLYFVYLQVFSLLNIIIAVAGSQSEIGNLLSTPQRVLHSLLCSRVILHIRAHSSGLEEITTTRVDIVFSEGSLAMPTENSGLEMETGEFRSAGVSSIFSDSCGDPPSC